MSDYKPVKGDRVRVVLEGEVGYVSSFGFDFAGSKGGILAHVHPVVSVEKVEPPVEVFKPGDVVRSKGFTKPGYVLTEKGYVDLTSGRYYEDGRSWCESAFTSKYYEKVNLG